MLQLLWSMFEKTGHISAYMFYRALEKEPYSDENMADLSSSADKYEDSKKDEKI
ncbi:MAG: YqzL family protein [Caldicoprobacterales bacterium]|mgnify:CR=1 FL=1|nr:YqzL family protein [Clostridiales bacterium]